MMGRALSLKVLAAVVVVAIIGAAVRVYVIRTPTPEAHYTQPSAPVIIPPAMAPVHTANWYVAHPEVLKEDEKRCAGDAATLTMAACQNVASADARLSVIEMQKAAAANASAGLPSRGSNKSP